MITLRCSRCGWPSTGETVPAAKLKLEAHTDECPEHRGIFYARKKKHMSTTFKEFLERKYAEGVDPSKAGRLLRQEVERSTDIPSNPYRKEQANDE